MVNNIYLWISLNIFILIHKWYLVFIFDLVKRISWYFINISCDLLKRISRYFIDIIPYRKLTYVYWFKELKLFMKYLIIIINLIDCRYVRGWWSCWFSCKILEKDIESLWLSFCRRLILFGLLRFWASSPFVTSFEFGPRTLSVFILLSLRVVLY